MTATPPPQRMSGAPRRKRVWIVLAIIGLLAIGFAIFGVARQDSDTSAEPTTTRVAVSSTPTAPAGDLPTFWVKETSLREDGEGGQLTIVVSEAKDDAQLTQIFQQVRARYPDGGWFVQIDCGTAPADDSGSRQANGKFAGSSPVARASTGLDAGTYEFEALQSRQPCPAQLPAAPVNTVTAQRVVDEFIARGLPAGDPRDNTGRSCGDPQCVQLVTTDDVSVYQFADAERAEYWANAVFPVHYRNGAIVLRFTQGGSHPTPEWAIPQYQAALDAVAGQ